jgi:Protein of unknown function (DUF4011)
MLHLIFGFLEWFESESSDQPHLAPLLLLPVTIEKGKADQRLGPSHMRSRIPQPTKSKRIFRFARN